MNLTNKNLIIIGLLIACGVLAGGLIYSQFNLSDRESSANFLSVEEAAKMGLDYINENLLPQTITASLVGTPSEEQGLYRFKVKIEDQEFFSYITKDGKFLFPEGIDLEEEPIVQTSESEEPQSSDIVPEELTEFIDCLKKTDFLIYGANWCGWTKKLVEMLGGFDMVKPIYVECTEEEELCREKGVEGYPTILIKGEPYQGARTFEDFVTATGCEAPSGAESSSGENPEDGGC